MAPNRESNTDAAKAAADDARQRAQAQRQAQASTATAADAARAETGDKVAPATDELVSGEQVATIDPADVPALLARLAALETLVASGRGLEGPSPDASKSTVVLGPAAANSPPNAVRSGSVTSAPNGQPIAKGYDASSVGLVVRDKPIEYVEGARVLLLAPHYLNDAVRNEGEVLEDYTGPLSSNMRLVDDRGRAA